MGVARQAGLIRDNRLPRAGRALFADALATTASGLIGTSSTTAYIESASGVAAGGRSGFTAVVVGVLFLLALFFSPLLAVVTSAVTAPALIVVGVLMCASLKQIDWERFETAAPAFVTVLMMPLTYSIATGIALGFIVYPLTMAAAGRARDINPLMYALAGLSGLLRVPAAGRLAPSSNLEVRPAVPVRVAGGASVTSEVDSGVVRRPPATAPAPLAIRARRRIRHRPARRQPAPNRRPGGTSLRGLPGQFPSSRPTGRSSSMWSQVTLMTTSSGTAMSMPATPQSQPQKNSAKKTMSALISKRRPWIAGVMKLPSSTFSANTAAGAASTCASVSKVANEASEMAASEIAAPA